LAAGHLGDQDHRQDSTNCSRGYGHQKHNQRVQLEGRAYRISPFLARVVPPATWKQQADEVAEIVEVRVSVLTIPEAHGQEEKHFPTWSAPRQTPVYRVGSYQIWGATYRILQPLIRRLLAGEWDVYPKLMFQSLQPNEICDCLDGLGSTNIPVSHP
jgi:hypothetical protein